MDKTVDEYWDQIYGTVKENFSPTNISGIVIPPRELGISLVVFACMISVEDEEVPGEMFSPHFVEMWWDWYASLPPSHRLCVQRVLIRLGYQLPLRRFEHLVG